MGRLREGQEQLPGHKDKPLTNDPMEATYIGIHMWAQAVEKAKSTDTDKVIAAMAGQTFKAPGGFTSTMDAKNHHLHKPVFIGEVKGDGQFNVVWKTPGPGQVEHGVDKRGVLRQHYDTDALDASTLLAAIFGFLPHDDKRLRASVLAIANELTENGFVLRYRTNETDDGMSGKEGTFLICSFWLVSALAIIGEEQRARDLMERLLRVASPLGLFAEEFDVDTGRHLGNFPQAFSHLALIEAAGRIIAAERMAEFS